MSSDVAYANRLDRLFHVSLNGLYNAQSNPSIRLGSRGTQLVQCSLPFQLRDIRLQWKSINPTNTASEMSTR